MDETAVMILFLSKGYFLSKSPCLHSKERTGACMRSTALGGASERGEEPYVLASA